MKKTSKTKIASTYALALYEAADEKNAVIQVCADVKELQNLMAQDQDVLKNFANPLWNSEAKRVALSTISKKMKLNQVTQNCLDVVVENSHFSELKEILQAYLRLYYQKNNIMEVDVQSAIKLSSAQTKKLEVQLEKLLEKKVCVSYQVKPELLGGLKVQYGSNMIDATLAGKLNQLEQMMKGGR